jgi:hypothetical protein
MVMRFRLKELQELMEFVGEDKRRKKKALQRSAVQLLPSCSTELQLKIKQLYISMQ